MRRRDFLKAGLAIGTVAITDPANAQTRLLSLREYLFLRFCRKTTFVRRNIYSLMAQNSSHPIIESYRDGVSVMKSLPDNDPTSWAYQANIHGTQLPFGQWPAGAPFETCEHSSVFFLTWHRMYLVFFERIVRKHSGNSGFSLPYWDYGKAGQASLPDPFRNPANNSNPLYNSTRSASVNNGNALSAGTVSAANALNKLAYLGGGQFQSNLEGTPHGAVHVSIGGNMGGFSMAGRDPIFWLHHCNIDRLWEKWLSQGGGRTNPIGDAGWMTQVYTFVDENGQFVSMTVADTLETVSQLKYQYEDPRDCIPLLVAEVPLHLTRIRFFKDILLQLPLAKEVLLKPGEKRIAVALDEKQNAELLSKFLAGNALEETIKNNRVIVSIDGIRSEEPMNGYFEAYLSFGLPDEMLVQEPVFIGNVTTFGADAESRNAMRNKMERQKDADHSQHMDGVSTTIDITDSLAQFIGKTGDGLVSLQISFAATTGVEDEALEAGKHGDVTFGQVELLIVPNDITEK